MALRAFVMVVAHWVVALSGVDASANLVVLGGKPVSIEEVPYMARFIALRDSPFMIKSLCGAIILNEKFVLSAAHCIHPVKGVNKYYVKVGTDQFHGDGQFHVVEKTIVHPKFDWFQVHLFDDFDYDVVVLKLKTKIMYGAKVQPIKMADPDLVLQDGDRLETVGFGSTAANPTEEQVISLHLLKIDIPYIDFEKCSRIFRSESNEDLTSRMICAGEIGKTSCTGDSGGPLVYKGMLVGVASFVIECGTFPVVYASVPELRGFIDATIKKYSCDC